MIFLHGFLSLNSHLDTHTLNHPVLLFLLFKSLWTSFVVPCTGILLTTQGTWIHSLVGKLGSHMLQGNSTHQM